MIEPDEDEDELPDFIPTQADDIGLIWTAPVGRTVVKIDVTDNGETCIATLDDFTVVLIPLRAPEGTTIH